MTEKQLNAQRHEIYQRLGRETAGAADTGLARDGLYLPATVEMRTLPDDVTRQMPNIAIYEYARAGTKVLLVEPTNRVVVAVLGQ